MVSPEQANDIKRERQYMARKRLQLVAKTVLGITIAASGVLTAAPNVLANEETPVVVQSIQYREGDHVLRLWKDYLEGVVHPLETIQPASVKGGDVGEGDEDKFKDLQFLKSLVGDSRIVMLGESTHGASEYNLSKVRLIQFLHEEMGFDVIAFESGLDAAFSSYVQSDSLSPLELMRSSVYPVWHTQEALPLFEYIADRRNSENPLILTGFDNQTLYSYRDFIQKWIGPVDSEMAGKWNQLEDKIWSWYAGDNNDLEQFYEEKPALLQGLQEISAFLQANGEKLKQAYPDDPELLNVTKRVLNNRIELVNTVLEASIKQRVTVASGEMPEFRLEEDTMYLRDRAMADNLAWLAEEVYPDKKIIVWGHNFHIRKSNTTVGNTYNTPNMTELLPEKLREESYVIGLYAHSGVSGDNMGEDSPFIPVQPGSVEYLLNETGHPYLFADLKNEQRRVWNAWMFTPRTGLYWGMFEELFIPREQYDGILFFRTVQTPQYIKK